MRDAQKVDCVPEYCRQPQSPPSPPYFLSLVCSTAHVARGVIATERKITAYLARPSWAHDHDTKLAHVVGTRCKVVTYDEAQIREYLELIARPWELQLQS